MEKLWLKCATKWLAESLCKQADAAYTSVPLTRFAMMWRMVSAAPPNGIS